VLEQQLTVRNVTGFINIRYGMFIVFGVMCLLAAVQFYFTYPETCGKTLEEVEEMFATGGPKPWKTRKGHSRLDALVDQAREKNLTIGDVTAGRVPSVTEHTVDQKA
jgi:hypothetical protein